MKTVLIRTIARPAVGAACALLAACAPYAAPIQAIPPGPTPDEVANFATAQMQYRFGLATGNGDTVAEADQTFRQIPREIFSRQDPKLFEAEAICERYRVASAAATGRSVSTPIERQCQSVERRYNEATNAIRRDLEARIAADDYATIAQAGAAHP